MCRIDGEIGSGDGGALAGNVRIVSCLGAFGILRGALKRFLILLLMWLFVTF